MRGKWLGAGILLGAWALATANAAGPSVAEARDALANAVGYFREEVSVNGSYLWTYSEDLTDRRGEGNATPTQGWVQPPGTPSVGMAYLRAYEATGDVVYMDAAVEVVHALHETQLASGGWDYRIEFDPDNRKRWHYRSDVEAGDTERGDRRDTSTYDDNNTQSALSFLMQAEQAFDGELEEAICAVDYGLTKLLAAQYPNGAWPQRYAGESRGEAEYPVTRARYPDMWEREYPKPDYRGYYTFNDNTIRDVIGVCIEAHRHYGADEYLAAAKRGGDFILLAQMPNPQPVWAQQYNAQMEPSWARKFEPASVTGGESVGAIRTLLDVYLYTGDDKYLDAIPPALDWFRRSSIDENRWARFYELNTNRPLYFTKEYALVYTDDDLPTHYSFQSSYGVSSMIEYAERVMAEGRDAINQAAAREATSDEKRARATRLAPAIGEIIDGLDSQGRWVEDGRMDVRTFNRNVGRLAEYIDLMSAEE
ncbi:pectic acid lyase [Candidatus Poribacteria bacterium]|nr:pectic acid lyase [Candidatus Poribacteria bacterium]